MIWLKDIAAGLALAVFLAVVLVALPLIIDGSL